MIMCDVHPSTPASIFLQYRYFDMLGKTARTVRAACTKCDLTPIGDALWDKISESEYLTYELRRSL